MDDPATILVGFPGPPQQARPGCTVQHDGNALQAVIDDPVGHFVDFHGPPDYLPGRSVRAALSG